MLWNIEVARNLYELAKLGWQFDKIGMYILSKGSIRLRNKNKGKRKKNKKVDSRSSAEEYYLILRAS